MDPSTQEKLIRDMEDDPVAFIEIFLGRELSKKQQNFLEYTKHKKHILAIWSRQTGKSTVIASYILWRLLYGKGIKINKEHMDERIAIVAPIKEQHVNLYEKIEQLVDKSDFISQFIIKINTEQIIMKNGNRAKFFSASPGSQIRGYTATCIVIDESQDVTDVKYSADVLPFGATTNALVIEAGTPKTKNHFYRAIQSKNVTVVKQPWFECPFLSEEYVMSQKAISPDALWRQEYLCFHPDTYIMSERPKKIIDIKDNDKVYNSKGLLVNVKARLKHYIEEEVLKITIWNGNSFICTKEHPIYSTIRTGVKTHSRKELTFNNAEKLKKGDFIHYPKLQIENKPNYFTKEELRLYGLWIAEGSISAKGRQLVFSMGSHEKVLIQEVQNSLQKIYGLKSTLHLKNKSKSSTQIVVNSTQLCKGFIEMFGKGAANKKIHSNLFKMTKQEISWLLSGYYDGDGHDSGRKFGCSSISKQLIEDINVLLLKFNIYSKISCMRNKEERKVIMNREVTVRPKWQLQTSGKSYNRMKAFFNEESIEKKSSKFIELENYDLLQIKEIEKIHYEGNVYNLETEDNNTYLTEIGSVHNCEFVEEGVLAFPSKLFEPENKEGVLTGRWNLAEYSFLSRVQDLTKDKVDKIQKILADGAMFTSGLDLGRSKDNTVYTIYRTDIRPIRKEVRIKFPLDTTYVEIAKIVGMFHKCYSPYEINVDYTNEKSFIEMLHANEVPVIVDKKQIRGAIQFTNKNKNEMVTNAQVLFQNFQLQLPKDDEELLHQFLNQQFETDDMNRKKFFHPSNEHDDELWSTLLALKNISLLTHEDTVSFVNPWEKFDTDVHGENRKSAREVVYSTTKFRKERRQQYVPAEMRRRG